MKRRELLKTGILGLTTTAVALSGCSKEEEKPIEQNITQAQTDDFDIIPKQTDTYKLSCPMLFDFKSIDDMYGYNQKYKKTQIKTLYNSIPWPQSEKYNEWFMLCRGGNNPDIKTYKDFEKYAKYSMDRGFDVVYLMNSPKAFNDRDIEPFKKDFYTLLDNLWNSGIKKLKFANTQVAQLINEHNPDFELSVATIMEYSSISQYRELFNLFPNINHICVPKDLNQNFKFLAALRKAFPKKEIEMMLNEGCFKWCPTRFSCMASSFSGKYKLGCRLADRNKHLGRVLNGLIYPWNYGYYSAIGINSFKAVPLRQRASDKETHQIAKIMHFLEYGFDDEANMVRIDMSEYMEKYSVSRLIGAPPGYVGYDEGGQLTEAVRRKPYSVVLFDEVEKAHPDVFNVLLQVLDDGRITDSQGHTVDFKNTILIMTSNIGSAELLDGITETGEISGKAQEAVESDLKASFRPEFLNRLDEIIMFKPLTEDNISHIIDLLLDDINKRIEDKQLKIEMTDSARKLVVENAYDPVYGARPLKRYMQKNVETLSARLILKGEAYEGDTIVIDAVDSDLMASVSS